MIKNQLCFKIVKNPVQLLFKNLLILHENSILKKVQLFNKIIIFRVKFMNSRRIFK